MDIYHHYNDIIMSAMASQITSLTVICSTVCPGAYQRKHQSSAPLAFVRRIHRWPLNSPHKGPVTRKMFPFHVQISEPRMKENIAWCAVIFFIEMDSIFAEILIIYMNENINVMLLFMKMLIKLIHSIHDTELFITCVSMVEIINSVLFLFTVLYSFL